MSKKSKKGEPKLDPKAAKKAAKTEAKRLAAEAAAEQAAREKAERKAAKKASKRSDGTFPEPGTPAAAIDAVADEAMGDAKTKAAELAAMSDADLKKRVQAKQAAREALEAEAADVDRDDEEAVAAYNARVHALGGGRLLTSNAERAKRSAAVEQGYPEPEPGEVEHIEAEDAAPKGSPLTTAAVAMGAVGTLVNGAMHTALKIEDERERKHVAEVVATIEGDVIAVGPERSQPIAVPSDATPADFAQNGRGQYLVERPADGRLVGYTRATTYIDNLEDKTALTDWKLRIALEGAALAEVEHDEHVLATIRDLVHRRDVAIAKAHKADRKGKLAVGELGDRIDQAMRDYKSEANALVKRALEVGGVSEKAQKGTDLHALTELHDLEGMAAVEAKHEAGAITDADLADVQAYADACERAGLKVVEVETVIVNDALGVAGRLDRIVMYKPEGAARAVRVVGDVKTGRIDFAPGKIAQQIALYAGGERYDLETHERSRLGASKTLGLLIHLPAGKAECTIYEVDLKVGAAGVRLSGDVRAWRRDGRKAIDLKKPIATTKALES